MALTDKQQAFISEYLIDLNATKAAIRAGYSPKSAADIGTQLLGKTQVQNEIARAKAERSRRTGITQDRVLRELARIAFVNPSKVVDLDKGIVNTDADEDDLAVIAGVKYKKTYFGGDDGGEVAEHEIKFCDKLKALDMLCKHLGMYDGKAPEGSEDGSEKKHGVVMMPAVMEKPKPPEYAPTEVETDEE